MILTELVANPRIILISIEDNLDAQDFASSLLSKFGFKESGNCVDLDQADGISEGDAELLSNMTLEDITIWAKNPSAVSMKTVIKMLISGDYISFGD